MNTALAQHNKAPQVALILITLIWGGTFLAVQYALNYSSPMFFVGCRFLAATIMIGLLSRSHLKSFSKQDLYAGSLIGFTIMLGYGSQTIGLQSISSSESAFLTALYVPLVPILLWLIFRKRPHVMTWMGVSFAFIGLVFLTGNGLQQISLNFGQILTLLGSIAIALEIILISYFAGKVNIQRVTVIQLAIASLLAFASMPLVGEQHLPSFSWTLVAVTVGLGLASALIQLTMNWAQRSVAPSQAAIIYAGEPVWAALFGRIAGERLPAMALLGGLLVVIGVILSEWKPKFLNKIRNKKEFQ
ncbi:DMT family transporter [Acinetobacter kyonggiensis]|uniref:EamA-like transporter family protein n=1 Tax=Acinetobacter kyonggiensis TaxID=595670 RepID=A0A1H3JF34_9GAMM|nr:DMT family transporter [Acinetobacter kyonggiensis]SDY38593.1 EamA-like transporter family protein [Acinetobacter kyonggiensis]